MDHPKNLAKSRTLEGIHLHGSQRLNPSHQEAADSDPLAADGIETSDGDYELVNEDFVSPRTVLERA